jgi:hypothetical protein
MSNSVFAELSFWLMATASISIPIGIYVVLLSKRAVSRITVLVLGVTLIVIAGVDIYFLRHMATAAAKTPSLADDALFLSEISFALYLFPLMFGGIGVNLLSHVLISHLVAAERRFDSQHPERRPLD